MKIIQNPRLSEIFWYKIGGEARFLAEISSREDFYEALNFAKKMEVTTFFPAGVGTNIVFSDQLYDGLVLHFIPKENGIELEDGNILRVFAGQNLDDVILFGFDKGLVGLEWAGGLPGSMGAAVRGNVGAFGGEIKDILVKAKCVKILENGDCEEITLTYEEMEFSYRSSRVKKEHLIVLEAFVKLKPAENDDVMYEAKEIYHRNIQYRKDHHPLEYPNCGSVFKNISDPKEVEKILEVWPDIVDQVRDKWHGKVSMGYIIGRLGLAGFESGGAQLSRKHHNFIINKYNATAGDVREIIKTVELKAQERFGFTPEVEVEML
jgi:UDP-N-acetylmuramate dehydrogenase